METMVLAGDVGGADAGGAPGGRDSELEGALTGLARRLRIMASILRSLASIRSRISRIAVLCSLRMSSCCFCIATNASCTPKSTSSFHVGVLAPLVFSPDTEVAGTTHDAPRRGADASRSGLAGAELEGRKEGSGFVFSRPGDRTCGCVFWTRVRMLLCSSSTPLTIWWIAAWDWNSLSSRGIRRWCSSSRVCLDISTPRMVVRTLSVIDAISLIRL
mmetsp:Transcript_36195/g.82237  ORF Transcript_36195/g.82237 Transcript_36195/m.82237 type:complete len:217 (-) Transcript_36195:1350-2000(-)